MMRPNFLSAENRHELERCVRRHREDHGIARRANAVLLLDDGESCAQIAKFLYLDDDTIRGWHKDYLEDGWEALAIDGWQGGKSRITLDQEAELCTWLEGRFCRSAGEIRAYIKSRFGPSYSHSGCLKLLRRLGFEYRKPKALPHVADETKQARFIAFYEALMNNLPADETVYFADAVHPEHQTKPAFGWVRKGSSPAVKTTSGRGRINIHGAICLENFDAPFVEPVTVDSNSAVHLLAKIQANNPTMSAIHVIWDNAAYHRCDAVKKWLARPECRIRLIQLPAYCPHLNPIERLWAVMHAHVTHNHFYATQKQFAEAILCFFRKTIPEKCRAARVYVIIRDGTYNSMKLDVTDNSCGLWNDELAHHSNRDRARLNIKRNKKCSEPSVKPPAISSAIAPFTGPWRSPTGPPVSASTNISSIIWPSPFIWHSPREGKPHSDRGAGHPALQSLVQNGLSPPSAMYKTHKFAKITPWGRVHLGAHNQVHSLWVSGGDRVHRKRGVSGN